MSTSESNPSAPWCERHIRLLLGALLLVCLGLRVWLASTGGQGYWPDEMRYSSAAREAAWQFVHGTARDGWIVLIGTADHLFFKIAGVPAALWELKFGNNPTLVASWFGLFSVLSIGLVAMIARAAGASAREGLLAAFFAAGASSLFYYSRHFFPYDLSLFFCLLALWLALGNAAWWRSALAGLCAGLGFLSYNGYWLLGGMVLVFHVLSGGHWRRMLARAAIAGAALLAPIVAAVLAARALDRDLIASFRVFSGTITQGDFGRGWLDVGQYLWDAEGGVLLMWLGLAMVGVWQACKGQCRRALLWVGAVAALYAGLVVCADVLRTFVVYGRTARVLVPFLCLAAAAGGEALLLTRARVGVWAIMVGIAATGAYGHMGIALRQIFPTDFLKLAMTEAQLARAQSPALLRVLNADRLGEGHVMSELRPHTIVMQRLHPLQFAPFLYEGFSDERRRRFATEDIAMKLVRVMGVTLPDIGGGFPGPLRLRVKFPTDRLRVAEPLLTSGGSGRANFVFVQYIDAGHIRIGYDCWNHGGTLSEPVAIDLKEEHEILLSSGAQLPMDASPPEGLDPAAWAKVKSSVVVAIDGAVVLSARVATNPADPRSLFLGTNVAGGSSAREGFSGEIRSVASAAWRDVLAWLPAEKLVAKEIVERVAAASPGPEWAGYCGPLRLNGRLPVGVVGQAEPLVVTGVTGKGDFVYVRTLSDGRVSFGFDHWGVGGAESAPVAIGESRKVDLVVSHGGLMPPGEGKLYAQSPGLAALRESVVIAVDGRTVLVAAIKSHATTAASIAVGRNPIGGSTTAEEFGGELFSITSEPVDAVLRLLNAGAATR